MENVTIQKINEVFLNVKCDPSIEMELSEHFNSLYQVINLCQLTEIECGMEK